MAARLHLVRSDPDPATRVVVYAMESSLQGPGRPVEIGGQDVGIVQGPDELDDLIDWAGLSFPVRIAWVGGGPDVWE
jgi:hypothetical protein